MTKQRITQRAIERIKKARPAVGLTSRLFALKSKPPRKGPPVLLIHGLNVPSHLMLPLQYHLERKHHRRTINLKYQWWFDDIPKTAEYLAKQVEKLNLREFDAVTHSMGGVLLRWAMNNHAMPKLRRAVLVAAPNDGCWLSDHLSCRFPFSFWMVFGQAALQLRCEHRGLTARAGRLEGAEVGVIAGGSGTPQGVRNWFGHPGDTDGTIAVAETILPGMKDFVLVNKSHTSILFSPQTAKLADVFLEHGVFRPRARKHHEEEEDVD